jgi:hypothetical protein
MMLPPLNCRRWMVRLSLIATFVTTALINSCTATTEVTAAVYTPQQFVRTLLDGQSHIVVQQHLDLRLLNLTETNGSTAVLHPMTQSIRVCPGVPVQLRSGSCPTAWLRCTLWGC